MSSIENKLINEIRLRATKGERKYGTTMDREDLSLHEWVQHLKEELMDAAVYATKLQEDLRDEKEELLLKQLAYDEEAIEKRMRVIGQNGNTGEHYDTISGTEAAYTRRVYPGEAEITINSPCVAHSHWSHGYSVGDIVTVMDDEFKVVGISDNMLSLQLHEEIN